MIEAKSAPPVNPEIAKVLRKQTDAERSKLEALILRDGIQDPIVVWEETGEILDGHNRVDIASGNNSNEEMFEYQIEAISLPGLDAAIEYVLERQEGKRNATPQDLSNARGKLYRRRKKKMGANRHDPKPEGKGGQFDHPKPEGKTGESVGADTGASEKTARRDAEYSVAIERLAETFGRDFEAHVLSGESKLSKTDVIMLAGELGKDDEVLYSAAELWSSGGSQTFKLAHMLAKIHHLGWTETEAALLELPDSEPGEKDRVRESAPQLKHLLKMPNDETAADLVTLVETGHPDMNNGKPVASVQKAHRIRQKERQEATEREAITFTPEPREMSPEQNAFHDINKYLVRLHRMDPETVAEEWLEVMEDIPARIPINDADVVLDWFGRFREAMQKLEKQHRREKGNLSVIGGDNA